MNQFLEQLNLFVSRHPPVSFTTDLFKVYLDRRIGRSAAELAYYLTLTIFPMLATSIWLVERLPITEYQLTNVLSDIFPPSTMSLVSEYLFYAKSTQLHSNSGLLTGGIITIFMAASAAFRSIVSTSSNIYNRKVYRGVWYWLVSLLFPVLLVMMVYISLLVVLTGRWFIRFLRKSFPFLLFPRYWPLLRLALMYTVAMLVLMLFYRITAPRGAPRAPVKRGAALTALVLTTASAGFSSIVSFSSRYSVVYGSLASIIILLVWLYLCANVVILGNVFNYVLWMYIKDEDIEYTFIGPSDT